MIRASLFLSLPLLVGCGLTETEARRPTDLSRSCPPDLAGLQNELFAERCGGSGCHGTDLPTYDLDLVSPDLARRVVNVPAMGCPGELLVVPGHPERSVLYLKIAEELPKCGVRMPLGGARIGANEVECVAGWIRSLPASPLDAGADAP